MKSFGFTLLFIFVSVFIILVCVEMRKILTSSRFNMRSKKMTDLDKDIALSSFNMRSKKMTDIDRDVVLSSICVPFFMIGVSIYVAVSEKFSKDIAGYELFLFVTPLLAMICLYTGANAVRVNTDKMYMITAMVVGFSLFIVFISYLLIFRVFSCADCMHLGL